MMELAERKVNCPYCGEVINILIDCSVVQQNYIEDCQVCCRPITFDITVDTEGELYVLLSSEND